MKKWNGFLAILWAMAICQLVFDISFTRHITSDSSYVSSKDDFTTSLWDGLQYFGGLSVSLWTNILALVVLKVVVTYEAFNIRKNFYFLSAVALVPPLLLCVLNIALYKDHYNTGGQNDNIGQIYSYSRTASILINFVAYAIISVQARKIGGSSVGDGEISQQQLMINELSRRMIYYPLMQTVSRIGASVYEPVYGYGPYLGNSSQNEYIWAIIYAITAPAAGIGYLIIFLMMQPYAYEQFVALLTTCKPVPAPSSSVSSGSNTSPMNRKYSETMSDQRSNHSHKTGGSSQYSGKSSNSSGYHDAHSRGSGTLNAMRRGLSNLSKLHRDDSIIKYLDDDELLKAIKDSGRNATLRRTTLSMRPSDRDSNTSSMASSSLYSRDTDYTSQTSNTAHTVSSASSGGNALLRANTLQNRDISGSAMTSSSNSNSNVFNNNTSVAGSVEMGSVMSFQTAMSSFRGNNNTNGANQV
eukprot:gene12924-14915_t